MNQSTSTMSTSTPIRHSSSVAIDATPTSGSTLHMTPSSNHISASHNDITASMSASSGTPPSGFKQSAGTAADDKKQRRSSLRVLMPKLPSSDSLSGISQGGPSSPANIPASIQSFNKYSRLSFPRPTSIGWPHTTNLMRSVLFKGLNHWADSSPRIEVASSEKLSDSTKINLNRKESYKAQRKNYRREKKRVASELLNSLQDPAIIVLADWLKVRGTLKSWTKLWCVLKPGLLLIYKSPKTKSSHWVGTILLTSCQIIERPSKKDGFCFKLFHPLDQSIWAPRGPDKETIGAVVQPLPTAYLIFRAPSQAAGKCWMDALELSLRCSALLLRSASGSGNHAELVAASAEAETLTMTHETQWSEADYEKHFYDHDQSLTPVFLAKYIPPTPPGEHRSPVPSRIPSASSANSRSSALSSRGSFQTMPRSPCPSPTPLFQQLYLAVAHWERVLAESPDLYVERDQILRDLQRLPFASGLGVENSEHGPGGLPYFETRPLAARLAHDVEAEAEDSDDEQDDNDHDDDDDDDDLITVLAMRRSRTNGFVVGSKAKPPLRPMLSNSSTDTKDHLDVDSQTDGANAVMSGLDSESESDVLDGPDDDEPQETMYMHLAEEEFGAAGEQIEELAEENKSLIWYVVKQVRPGMDLSKVVLPTFILEPRSFLDKLSDSYYHADFLSQAVLEDDPFTRMKLVVKWYLSGFYKKPKGLKKPYNPCLGETFRCYWQHENGSRTFYIAEQVSHHPPVSAFYVTNRQDGFAINCSMLAKSKFYGNSTSAILDGTATLTLLPRGESYTLTIPYAHCKGILMGTLSMELGGKVAIECEYTGYKADIEFKLKPFLGGGEYTNLVTARLKLGKETLATIKGHWDGEMKIKDARSGDETVLFAPTAEVRSKRLKRFTVPIESQGPNESERLWQHVSAAIARDDQNAATEEKTTLEEAQRTLVKERQATCTDWTPVLFQQDLVTGQWHYKCADLRPWDPRTDLRQYENNYEIQTRTCHVTPMVRTASIINSEPIILQADSRSSLARKKTKRMLGRKMSTPDMVDGSDSSHSTSGLVRGGVANAKILESIQQLNRRLDDHGTALSAIKLSLDKLTYAPAANRNTHPSRSPSSHHYQTILYVALGLFIQSLLAWIFTKK